MPTTFANTINGNELLAKRAECDYAGNDLQTTYATKSDVTTGLASKEDSANKAQSINTSSTTDFPSSKATADFVNSSVATNTAKFLGNFTLTDLSLVYPATDAQIETALDGYTFSPAPTNNDYVYVEIQDPQTPGVTDVVKRFKFDGTNWLYEYSLNNSSFTAAEIAAIDSGINSTKVGNYDTHIADTDIHVTLSDKSTWNGKQDAISDLATIRSGAAAGATALQDMDVSRVALTGSYTDLLNKPTIPSGTQLVPAATSADANKVLTVDSQGTPAWATPAAGGVTDVEVDGTSVVSGGVASITMPTVDQTYNSASTDAQSGTAVAQAVATKEDVFDVGTGLEMDTSGSTPTLQVEAPVDIVAGPGIVIDNPDGNTLRVSVDQAIETVLWSDSVGSDTCSIPENIFNFERCRVTYMGGAAIKGEVEIDISSSIAAYNLTFPYFRPDSTYFVQFQCTTMTVSNNGTTLAFTDGKRLWIAPTAGSNGNDTQPIKCTKIVGIHRIANN